MYLLIACTNIDYKINPSIHKSLLLLSVHQIKYLHVPRTLLIFLAENLGMNHTNIDKIFKLLYLMIAYLL